MHSILSDSSEFFFDLSMKDFDTDDNEPVSTYEAGQTSTNGDFECSNFNLEFDSCSENTNGSTIKLGQSASEDEICYEEPLSNFL